MQIGLEVVTEMAEDRVMSVHGPWTSDHREQGADRPKDVAYPGEHAPIIDQRAWDKAHAVMAEPCIGAAQLSRHRSPRC